MSSIELHNRINSLPENLRKEAEDFIQLLIEKSKNKKYSKKDLDGILKGKIKISEDFDEPLEYFKDYME